MPSSFQSAERASVGNQSDGVSPWPAAAHGSLQAAVARVLARSLGAVLLPPSLAYGEVSCRPENPC